MSKLNVDQKKIADLLCDRKADFLIPDYQRPYAWGEDECLTLWDDLYSFAIPDNDFNSFDTKEEYFLGPIVTFRNKEEQLEIIDGQQRLTTILLLLRAFYDKFITMDDKLSKSVSKKISECVWKTDEFGEADLECLKIDSQVASDENKSEFLYILRRGVPKENSLSRYAENYEFLKNKIENLAREKPGQLQYLATRILNNVILLPIEAESQDTALRIFSTLNDRGLPLADADIFKSQFYKFYSNKNQKEEFVKRWKNLESITSKIFSSNRMGPMDELFTKLMYFERARLGNKRTTTEALRDFFSRNSYALLHTESTLEKLELLADFWQKIYSDSAEFSDRIKKSISVLKAAPNSMWTYITSVYFLSKRNNENALEEKAFYEFLERITAFILAYSIVRPGVNALRTPLFSEMVNLVNGGEVTFAEHLFNKENLTASIQAYAFTNLRPITKSMLAWWAAQSEEQTNLQSLADYQIEHIYAKKRADLHPLSDSRLLESLGNKALLESSVNIRAADYAFKDKRQIYLGKVPKSQPTKIVELLKIANTKEEFNEEDIKEREKLIINSFVEYLRQNKLIEE